MAIHKLKIFAGSGSHELAAKIAESYGCELGDLSVSRFSDGEFQPAFEESIRGCTVFIVQSTPPPAENLMELLLMIDAAKRASAYKVIAVIPYFGWARQDRKGPSARIDRRQAGGQSARVGRRGPYHHHGPACRPDTGLFFDVPLDHIYASRIFVPYIESLGLENLSVATPDIGGAKRANSYASYFNAPLVICHKHRNKPNEVAKMIAIGEVKDRNIILLDDMIDTGGTITKAANMFMEMGARSVRAVTTHPVLSGKAYENLKESQLAEVIVTDTIPLRTDKDTSKITVLSTADVLADVIERVHNYKEISSQFVFVK